VLIQTTFGDWINTDHIVMIIPPENAGWEYIVYMSSGKTLKLQFEMIEQIVEAHNATS
jgi:hypothetical protein